MNCVLTLDQQKKLFKKVYSDLNNHPAEIPFDFKKYVTDFYNSMVEATKDNGLALSYVSLLPQNIRVNIGVDKDLSKRYGSIFAEMVEREAEFDNFDTVSQFVSPVVEVAETLQTVQTQLQQDSLDPTKQDKATEPILVEQSEYEAVVTSFLSDNPYEKSEDDIRKESFYSTVKRKLIKAMLNKHEGETLHLPGVGTVYLTLMASDKIEEKHLREDVQNLLKEGNDRVAKAHKEGVSLVLTDDDGNIVYLDDNFDRVGPEAGKPVYYNMRAPRTDDKGNVIFEQPFDTFETTDLNRAKALAKKNNISLDDAKAIVTRQLELYKKVREYINKDRANNKIDMVINGGAYGQILTNKKLSTPVAGLNMEGQTFAPYVAIDDNSGIGQRKGMTYIKMKGLDNVVQIEKGTFKKELADKLASLLFDDIQIDTPKGKRKITAGERIKLFEQFVYTGADKIRVYPTADDTGINVMVTGDKLNVSDKEIAKKQISTYLTRLLPTREIKESQAKGKRIIKTTDPDYKSKFGIDTVLQSIDEGTGQSRFYVVEYAKLNVKRDLLESNKYDDFDITDGVLTKTQRPYVDFIRDNFVLFHPLDAAGNIQSLNAYLTFEPKPFELNKLLKPDFQKEIIDKAKTEVPKESGINNDLPETNMSSKDKIRNKMRNNSKFNKLVEQQGIKATDAQIDKAYEWYKNHPLSKQFPFEDAFNMVNTAQPNSIATWQMNGITLYKGADYSDLYHEAWHGFTQVFLSKDQKIALYNEARKKTGWFKDYKGNRVYFKNANDLQIEEYLAEDFRTYMLNKGDKTIKDTPVRNGIFRRILNFLKELFGDSSISQIAIDTRANKTINDLFEKLRIGDLTEYTFAAENRNYNILNKGLEAITPKEILNSLSYEDSALLVETIDSLFSEFADDVNSGLDDEQKLLKANLEAKESLTAEEKEQLANLKGQQTFKYSTVLFSTQDGLLGAYEYSQLRLAELRNTLAVELEKDKANGSLQKKIDLLDYALRNFGNVNNLDFNKKGKGVIGYHLYKSEFISPDTLQDVINEELDEAAEVEGKEVYDRGGNEKSHYDLAAKEIIYMIRGLHATDEAGKITLNKLGIPELASFKETYRRLAETLKGVTTPQKMYDLMVKESESYPPLAQLINKLGPVSYSGQTNREVDNWTKFWQTFNKPRIELIQMNIDMITVDETGKKLVRPDFEVTIGNASADFRKIGLAWESSFSEAVDNPYILNDVGGNYLDVVTLVEKYPTADSIRGKEYEFLTNIGIPLKNSRAVKDALKAAIEAGEINIGNFPEKLKALMLAGRKVRFINSIIGEVKYIDPVDNKEKVAPGEFGNYQKLQRLEMKYSDMYSDFMVSNAAGDSQSEFSLNTTLTQIQKKVNEAGSFVEMVSNPAMNYLDLTRNPFVKASVWLNSLFDMTAPGGPKRKDITLNVQNLSGVAMLQNGNALQEGVISAAADEHTKLILDLHLQVMKGTPELIRSADKKTSLAVYLNEIKTEGKNKTLYVDTTNFIDQGGVIIGEDQAFDIIYPYLQAELDRVLECRKALKSNSGVTEFDFGYLDRGKDFVMFDDVLSHQVKEELYNSDGVITDTLKSRIATDLYTYFNTKTKELTDKFNEAPFIASGLIDQIKRDAKKENISAKYVSDNGVKDAIMRSWVYNNWIHHFEEMILLYGDYALYNTEKDDLHKRNASINSTGDILRTDKPFLDHVNENIGRPLTKLKNYKVDPYNGTFNTAVMEDIEIGSVYIDEYKKLLGDQAKKYDEGKVNEGDAQGWISFDAYRIIGKSLSDWSNEQEELYQKIVNGQKFPYNDLHLFFPVRKMSYMGSLQADGLPLMALHKFSLFPLIPNVITGTNLEKLHDKMMREGIDYALFKSGSKISTITAGRKQDKLYSDNKLRTFEEKSFTKNTVFADYLKDQIKVTSKFKSKVTFFSQLRKLIDIGTMENGKPINEKMGKLRANFLKSVFKLGEVKKQELLREIGWKLDENGVPTGDLKNLLEVVVRELDRSDLAEHERAFIEIGPDGKLKHDLSLSQSSDKIERVLMSVVNKRLVRYKVNGEQLVQVSSAGFENIGFAYGSERKFEKPTSEDLAKYGSNDLPTYHMGADGLVKAAKVKIAIQGNFRKLLDLEDVYTKSRELGVNRLAALNALLKDENWLNQGDNRKFITMIGARIPTQGLNSMEFVEVYEFLPPEAGNIIVSPPEITSKSGTDFDYDKLPMMMPNIVMLNGKVTMAKNYTRQEAKEIYDTLLKYELNKATLVEVNSEELFNYLKPGKFFKFEEAIIKMLGDSYLEDLKSIIKEDKQIPEFAEFFDRLNGSKSVENDIIQNVRAILEQGDNFKNLIQPNDTNLVEPLAKDLEPVVSDFNSKKTVFDSPRKSGTRGLEVLFNLYKHQSNSIGKETLGIGAVDNTYNSIFNAIGFHMNPSNSISPSEYQALVKKEKPDKEDLKAIYKYRRQVLLMPHNKLNVDDEDVISLSGLKDVTNENNIADVVSQLINGWVDVAKDAWIFNIQGNKEIAPTLLFMIQAGVPLKTAVYLVSQPLVREYVRQQRLKKSTFAEALGTAASNPMRFRVEARNEIFDNPAYGFNIEEAKDKEIYDATVELTNRVGADAFTEKTLKDNLDNKQVDDNARAAFLHFLEIENMSKVITAIKSKTNVDTSPSITLFEAQETMQNILTLKQEGRIPSKFINAIFNDSTVGAYYTQPFVFDLFKDLFRLRNHSELNEFINTMPYGKEAKKAYGEKETFVAEFRNDLMSYIFQNSARAFDMDATEYNASGVKTMLVKDAKLNFGAFVKDDILYVDKVQLTKEFQSYSDEDYEKKQLAPINKNTFKLQKEYNHFIYERETLRNVHPFSETQQNIDYNNLLLKNIRNDKLRKEGETQEEFVNNMKRRSYEEWLRNKALDNILNPWNMFKSYNSYADKFVRIRKKYPQLLDEYSLVRNLQFKSNKMGYRNLRLSNNKLERDTVELYNENLKNLANPSVIKVDDPKENQYISDLFAMFPLYAFMQSGMNTKSVFSLNRIVPQDTFIRMMEQPAKEWEEKMGPEILEDFYNRFIENNINRGTRSRTKDYLSNSTLDKPIKSEITPVSESTGQLDVFEQEEQQPKLTSPLIEDKKVKEISDAEVLQMLSHCFNK